MIKKYQRPSDRLYKESDPDLYKQAGWNFIPHEQIDLNKNKNLNLRLGLTYLVDKDGIVVNEKRRKLYLNDNWQEHYPTNSNKNKPLYEYTPAQQHVNDVGLALALTENVARMYDGKEHSQYQGFIDGMNDVGNAATYLLTAPAGGTMAKGIWNAVKTGAYKPLLRALAGSLIGMYAGNQATRALSNGKYNSTAEFLNANGFNKYNSMMLDPGAWAGGYAGSRYSNGGFNLGGGRRLVFDRSKIYSNIPGVKIVSNSTSEPIDLNAEQWEAMLKGPGAEKSIRTIGGRQYVTGSNGITYRRDPNFSIEVADPDVQIISGPFKPSSNVQVTTNPNIRTRLSIRLSYETPLTEISKEVYPDYNDPALSFDPASPYYYEEPQLIDDDFFNIFGLKKGGLIPRFLNSGQFRRLSMSKYYQDPKTKKVYEYNNGKYTLITKPITISNAFLTTAYSPNGETARSYRGLLRGANASGTSEQVALSRLPKLRVTPINNTFKPDTPEVRAERERLYNERMNRAKPVDKSIPQNTGTKGNKPKGGTGGRKDNARTTAKPAATTFTESPTNITDQDWLDARNAAMRRGWGTYNYNGLTYQFTEDEFLQAKRNWNNRRKAGYQAEGLLNLNSTVKTPDNKVETSNVPDYGYGVTDSNLKLGTDLQYYPSHNSDESLRSIFSKFGLNFDDYKQLTADKLPTNVAPVSQEVKTFNPGNTVLSPSYRALRDARLEDEALKRSKLLPFAKQGIKLIRRK